ncbi:MAG: prephenate dehydrogenase/arogenate dehydrogenase family protein [Bacillota bacterium]
MARRVAVIGLGLIGGSICLGLKDKVETVVGVETNPGYAEYALRHGFVDRVSAASDIVGDSDLIFVCVPPSEVAGCVARAAHAAAPGTVITDTASVKRRVCEEVIRQLPGERLFVGGHPMAGRERSGPAFADAGLFCGKPWVLTDRNDLVEDAVESLGAIPVFMSAEEHDRVAAVVSHVPLLVSAALMLTLGDSQEQMASSGFCDMTRLAASNLQMCLDICAENRDAIADAGGAFLSRFKQILNALLDEQAELPRLLGEARQRRLCVAARKGWV